MSSLNNVCNKIFEEFWIKKGQKIAHNIFKTAGTKIPGLRLSIKFSEHGRFQQTINNQIFIAALNKEIKSDESL